MRHDLTDEQKAQRLADGNRFRRLRQDARLKAGSVAVHIGVTQPQMSRMEYGEAEILPIHFAKLNELISGAVPAPDPVRPKRGPRGAGRPRIRLDHIVAQLRVEVESLRREKDGVVRRLQDAEAALSAIEEALR